MNFIALIFLAFAMSTDAFAAAIGKGAKLKKPPFLHALKLGVTFGVVEAITPVIGWMCSRLRQGIFGVFRLKRPIFLSEEDRALPQHGAVPPAHQNPLCFENPLLNSHHTAIHKTPAHTSGQAKYT